MGKRGLIITAIIGIIIIFMLFVPSIAWAETEPNDTIGTADSILSGDTVTGTLNADTDPDDYYSIYLAYGDRLAASLSGPSGTDFDLYLYGPSGNYITASESSDSSESYSYTASTSGTYYVNPWAWSGGGSGTYTLSVSVTTSGGGGGTTSPTGGSYTFYEANYEDYADVTVIGSYSGYSTSFDFSNGNGVFYGRCIEISVVSFSSSTLYLSMERGTFLMPDSNSVQRMVVTQDVSLTISSFSSESITIYAMCTEMHDDIPAYEDFTISTSHATGNLESVVDEIYDTGSQNAAGQCAVWAVTDSAEKSDLEAYSASSSQINDAQDILDGADVNIKIVSGFSDYLVPLVIVIVIIIVIVVVVVAVRAKPKTSTSPPPISPYGSVQPPPPQYQAPPPAIGYAPIPPPSMGTSNVPDKPTQTFCGGCGKQIPFDSTSCQYCGFKQ